MVRVIQGALTRSHYQSSKVHKQILAVKKLFEHEVKQLFPWCEVHKSGLWEYNLSLPKYVSLLNTIDVLVPDCGFMF